MFEDSTFESGGRIKTKASRWMMVTGIINGSCADMTAHAVRNVKASDLTALSGNKEPPCSWVKLVMQVTWFQTVGRERKGRSEGDESFKSMKKSCEGRKGSISIHSTGGEQFPPSEKKYCSPVTQNVFSIPGRGKALVYAAASGS